MRNILRKLAVSDEILMQVEKPARYIGNEVNMVVKDPKNVDIRFCMCFPDVYEIGMSHLGIQILYDMFNKREDTYCERVYSPWMDMDKVLREKHIPLFALESQQPVKEFDFLGITLQYEMCYTNVLQILDLSQIPLLSKDRTEEYPIVIGGGPCAYNPEPLADFFDLFYIGEGETVYDDLLNAYKENKKNENFLDLKWEMVYSGLSLKPKHIHTIMEETDMSLADTIEVLLSLEMRGYVKKVDRNYYVLVN